MKLDLKDLVKYCINSEEYRYGEVECISQTVDGITYSIRHQADLDHSIKEEQIIDKYVVWKPRKRGDKIEEV